MTRPTGDLVIQTLLEALRLQPPTSTLVWGQGLGRVSRLVGGDAPVHTLLQDASDLPAPVGETSFGVEPPDGAFERVVTRMPRSKDALRWRLARAAAALPPEGELWLAGHQREGIKSAVRILEEAIGATVTVHTKRRCRVLVARRRPQVSAPPSLDAVAQRISFEAAGQALSAVTLPGVFAHGRLDGGTQRLLAWLEVEPPTGCVLDLGAGAGILGVACAAHAGVEQVMMVEVGWVGAEACRRTIAANEGARLTSIEVQHADVLDAASGPFDLVVTNPPFHDGREEDRQLIARFAQAAAMRLRPGGRFLAVCNTHLPYREVLAARFTRVSVAWEDTRFRIWTCREPRR